jgi:hypothetical protein
MYILCLHTSENKVGEVKFIEKRRGEKKGRQDWVLEEMPEQLGTTEERRFLRGCKQF